VSIHYSESEAHVIDYLKKEPKTTVAQLVAKGYSRSTVRNALIKAQSNGNLIMAPEWPRRYSWIETPEREETYSLPIKPEQVKPKDFGPKFQQGRPNIVKVLNSINPEKQDRDKVLKDLEAVGRAVLGLYIALSRVEDGPEWRQEAGL
jgi:hypothetical protein